MPNMLTSNKFWFRAGATALLLTGLLHSLSLVKKPEPGNEAERQLLDLMFSVRLAGLDRTMWDLFFFFSLTMTLFSVFVAVLDLLFARFYMPSVHERWVVGANFLFFAVFLVPLWMFTFSVPFACYAICCGLFGLAFFFSKK